MRIIGGILFAVALAATASRAGEAPAFVCAPAAVTDGRPATPALSLADRFGDRDVTLGTGADVCRGEAPSTAILAGYAAKVRPRKAKRVGATTTIVTRFGSETLNVKALDEVRVPAGEQGDPGGPAFGCYTVRQRRAPRVRVAVAGATGEESYDLARATHVCVATIAGAAPDYVCHALRPVKEKGGRRAKVRPTTITLTHGYGTDTFRVGSARELCVPALGMPPPPPVDPPFTLTVAPLARTVIVGGKPRYSATARFSDGHAEDRTDAVAWSSSDETVARFVPSSTGGVFIDTIAPGTTVISATDLATGIASGDSGGDATLTVVWPLEKLIMAPHTALRPPGGHQDYTVIGWFTGGFTRNVTQRVTYSSSDPAVAVATNQPGSRSRVSTIAAGTTTITATDPITGITTTESGNDASLRVAGSLSFIVISSNLRYGSRFPGQSQRFTARGYYSDGSSINVTQQCMWSSSDPSVAAATNTPGDRSRIDALVPGLSFITCTDPLSGVQSYGAPFYVLGDLLDIQVDGTGSPPDWIEIGEEIRPTALGHYVGGGYRNLTQEVVWTSRDPEVALATNAVGDKSRFVGLAGGEAKIFVTDPTTGISSGDATIVVLGDLVSLSILHLYPDYMAVGASRYIEVSGLFVSRPRRIPRSDFVLESSNPAAIEVLNGNELHALASGTADVVARHLATGIESPPVTFRVKGDLASITLTPATATRGIGEWESFTAIGNYPPDFTELLTQRLVYDSSDESVAVADNAIVGGRSRVRTVGAGTAVITATDPQTGVFATATITVLPGTIERVTIQPETIVRNPNNDFSFTAIGHYPDGSTINVTQIVTWTSLDPAIAETPNPAGNRSRVVGRNVGTATIVASHPSGVSSHDTGDDATFVVRPIVGLSLTPSPHVGPVGMTERYTLVGTFDDATTINLTQQAYYWSRDWSVAQADNREGDRSAVRLVAPGFTTVHAQFADWSGYYPITSGSVAGAFLGVAP